MLNTYKHNLGSDICEERDFVSDGTLDEFNRAIANYSSRVVFRRVVELPIPVFDTR